MAGRLTIRVHALSLYHPTAASEAAAQPQASAQSVPALAAAPGGGGSGGGTIQPLPVAATIDAPVPTPLLPSGKPILQSLNCEFHSGQLVAVMGASGSGKSTLLRCLAGRQRAGYATGLIEYFHTAAAGTGAADSERQLSSAEASELIGFIGQDDDFLPHLTVRETLTYIARLRSAPPAAVENLITELSLRSCADTRIGHSSSRELSGAGEGISGGEMRRVSLAIQLLSDPPIILADEPTSGLDSLTAHGVVRALRARAAAGCLVIAVIHQPSEETFRLFDSVLMLVSGGQLIYSGSVGNGLLTYFETAFQRICPDNINPADFVIDLCAKYRDRAIEVASVYQPTIPGAPLPTLLSPNSFSGGFDGAPAVELLPLPASDSKLNAQPAASGTIALTDLDDLLSGDRVPDPFIDHMSVSKLTAAGASPTASPTVVVAVAAVAAVPPSAAPPAAVKVVVSRGAAFDALRPRSRTAPFCVQLDVLLRRGATNVIANRSLLWTVLIECILSALVYGWIYWGAESVAGVRSKTSLLYQIACTRPWYILRYHVFRWSKEMALFDREREDRMYDIVPFLCADFILQIPSLIVAPTLFGTIAYFMGGLRTDDSSHFGIFIATHIGLGASGAGLGLLFSAFSRNYQITVLLFSASSLVSAWTTGYFLNPIPNGLQWLQSLNFGYYGYRLLSINQFAGLNPLPSSPAVALTADEQLQSGDVVLDGLGFRSHGVSSAVLAICIIPFIFYVISYGVLRLWPRYRTQTAPPDTDTTKSAASLSAPLPSAGIYSRGVGIRVNQLSCAVPEQTAAAAGVGGTAGGGDAGGGGDLTADVGWHNLATLSVVYRYILAPMTIDIKPASFTVIMGPTGSAKTTLLSILRRGGVGVESAGGAASKNGPSSHMRVRGSVLYDQKVLSPEMYSKMIAFVPQHDSLISGFTVTETLEYAARLRGVAADLIPRVIQRTLTSLELDAVAGSFVDTISGGERKRVLIGIQLVADPPILILDEPTTGLDASQALHITELLKQLSYRGKTVVCTLHQPRAEQFACVDDLILLARGRLLYAAAAFNVVNHFVRTGIRAPPARASIAEWLLETVCVKCNTPFDVVLLPTPAVSHVSAESKLDAAAAAAGFRPPLPPASSGTGDLSPLRTPLSAAGAFRVLLDRSWLALRRRAFAVLSPRWMSVLGLSVWLLIFFSDALTDDATGINNRLTLMTIQMGLFSDLGFPGGVTSFVGARDDFFRDVTDDLYGAVPFLCSYMCIEVGSQLIASLFFTFVGCVSIGMSPIADAESFIMFWFVFFLLLNAGESVAVFTCSVVNDPTVAVTIVNPLVTACVNCCGLYAPSLPYSLQIINYAFLPRYAVRVLANQMFRSKSYGCTTEQLLPDGTCAFRTGEQVLDTYNLSADVALSLGIAVLLTALYRIAALIALYRAARQRSTRARSLA